ncbi:MAG: hypothetical protein QM731_25405 [Chitinophagaceae bacterium]
MKKIVQMGKQLSRTEMKNISGGTPLSATSWFCPDPGATVCFTSQPQTTCGYAEPCVAVGTCTKFINVCII